MQHATQEELISVIVPVFNGERYIQQCIDSILSSTLKNFEIIIVDDGSTDKTGEILKQVLNNKTVSREIRVLFQSNNGVSSARNLGIRNAKGKWITFVDADDIIEPQFLGSLLDAAHQDPSVQMVQAGCKNYINEKVGEVEQCYPNKLSTDAAFIYSNIRGLTFSKLFLKSVIEEYDLQFDEKMPLAEDLAFTLDYINHVSTVMFSSEIGYLYRRHPNSVTSKPTQRPYDTYLFCFYHLYNSMVKYENCHLLQYSDQTMRRQHIGRNLFYAISSMYHNKMTRKERLKHLKMDYSKEQYALFCSKPFGKGIKHLVCLLLVYGFPMVFDILFSCLYKIKQ